MISGSYKLTHLQIPVSQKTPIVVRHTQQCVHTYIWILHRSAQSYYSLMNLELLN